MAFLCQMMWVNSRDLKLVFQGSDVLFFKKNNLVRSSAWVFPVFILFCPCVVCIPVGFAGMGHSSFSPRGVEYSPDMEYRRYTNITWVPCC